MADRFELVALALPPGCAPETLPTRIVPFIAACWPGMSRAQLLNRVRRLTLRASLCMMKEPGTVSLEGVRRYALALVASDGRPELVAHVRRVARPV